MQTGENCVFEGQVRIVKRGSDDEENKDDVERGEKRELLTDGEIWYNLH